ncbi:MAG: hypothetical protein AAGD33_06120 [Actinomycetota bacterium]
MSTRRPLAAAAAVLTLTLAACGASDASDDGADGIASLGTSVIDGDTAETGDDDSDDDIDDDSEAPSDPDEAFDLYERCLQDAGVDTAVLSGEPGGGGAQVEGDVTENGSVDADSVVEFDDESFAAFEDCEKHLANTDTGFDLSPEQQAELADAELAFARCMREQGIDMPDPSSSDGGAIAIEIDDEDVDPDAMDAAAAECNSVFDEVFDDVFDDLEGEEGSS